MKPITCLLFLFFSSISFAQIDSQTRYSSDERKYYIWNEEKAEYTYVETEYENSIIDIREKGSKTNGYIAISMVDNGQARLYHGSIKDYKVSENNEITWVLQSKTLRSKLTFNPVDKTFTYLYDSNEDKTRYLKIFVFKLRPEEETK